MSVFMPHQQWDQENPDALTYAQDVALSRAASGLPAERKFPCPGNLVRAERVSGRMIVVRCDVCDFETGVQDRPASAEETVARAHLPAALLSGELQPTGGLAEARGALEAYIRCWGEQGGPKPPLLVGPPGRGKSMLLAHMAALLVRAKHVDVFYVTMSNLLDAVKRSYHDGGDCEEWDRAHDVGLLVLDDIGAELTSDWAQERLVSLLDFRYREGRPLWGATNLPPAKWDVALGQRAASRLTGMTKPVAVTGDDWRRPRL